MLFAAGVVVVGVTVVVGQVLTAPARTRPPKAPCRRRPPRAGSSRSPSTPTAPWSPARSRCPTATGLIELVVRRLPAATSDSSLYSEGTDGIRVLTTRFRTRPVKEDTREEVRKLEDELEEAAASAEKLQAEIDSARAEHAAARPSWRTSPTSTTVHATEKGKLNSDAVITLAKYVMEQRDDKAKELVDAAAAAADQQGAGRASPAASCAELTAGSSKTERDAVIVVDHKNGAGAARCG